MKTKNELIHAISAFDRIPSKTGRVSYSQFRIDGDVISFKRDSTKNRRVLDIDDLYNAYKKENFLNTIILRNYLSTWVFSPALAILIAAKFYDRYGNRIR